MVAREGFSGICDAPAHPPTMKSLIVDERATLTCGLRISDDPTSDNLTPQETTNQDTPDMGSDGSVLSCPGSKVVANTYQEFPDSVADDEAG